MHFVCVCVDVDADSSPVVVARVKALIWRIILDRQGVLTHPSNTQGVAEWDRGGRRCEREIKSLSGHLGAPNVLRDSTKLGVLKVRGER